MAGFADGGEKPGKELALIPGAVRDADQFLAGHADTKARRDRIAALVDGFETPFGLELLATVHWLVAHESVGSAAEVVKATYGWNDRKKQFTDRQLHLAMERLAQDRWIPESVVSSR